MKPHLLELFPSPIMVVDYEGQELAFMQEQIAQALAQIKLEEDLARHAVKTSYGQGVNDILNHGLQQLGQTIDEAALLYQHKVGVKPKPMQIAESWVNEYGLGGYMSEHEHPGMTISGVYYYQADAQAGDLWFRNPNQLMLNCHWPSLELAHYQNIPIRAQEGRLVLFPSWLAHSVGTVKSTEKHKISISFNLR